MWELDSLPVGFRSRPRGRRREPWNLSFFTSLNRLTCRHGFEPSGRTHSPRGCIFDSSRLRLELVGLLVHVVAQCGDVAPPDVGHLAAAVLGPDEELDRSPVLLGRARLAMRGDVLLQKAFPESPHGRHFPVGAPLRG